MTFSKKIWFSVLGVFVIACQEDQATEVEVYQSVSGLPQVADLSSCVDDDVSIWSGADLFRVSERIVVGTVSDVSVETELPYPLEDCEPDSFSWSLIVNLEVEENLKGDGSDLEFGINSESMKSWLSKPVFKLNNKWAPSYEPRQTQVSQTLAWSGDTGVQVGQTLVAFLRESEGRYSNVYIPLAEVTPNGVTFQSSNIGNACVKLDSAATSAKSVAELRDALQVPELEASQEFPYADISGRVRSDCQPKSLRNSVPLPEEPDPSLSL